MEGVWTCMYYFCLKIMQISTHFWCSIVCLGNKLWFKIELENYTLCMIKKTIRTSVGTHISKTTKLSSILPSWTYFQSVDKCETLSAFEASSNIIATNAAFWIFIVISSSTTSWIDWIKSFSMADDVALNTVAVSIWSFRTVSNSLGNCTKSMKLPLLRDE